MVEPSHRVHRFKLCAATVVLNGAEILSAQSKHRLACQRRKSFTQSVSLTLDNRPCTCIPMRSHSATGCVAP